MKKKASEILPRAEGSFSNAQGRFDKRASVPQSRKTSNFDSMLNLAASPTTFAKEKLSLKEWQDKALTRQIEEEKRHQDRFLKKTIASLCQE